MTALRGRARGGVWPDTVEGRFLLPLVDEVYGLQADGDYFADKMDDVLGIVGPVGSADDVNDRLADREGRLFEGMINQPKMMTG